MIKTVKVIKNNLELLIDDLRERHNISMTYGFNEVEYQHELIEWTETLSRTVLEMDNHINQLD